MVKEYTEQDFQKSSATERNLDVTVADRLHASCSATEVQQECNKDATLELPATKSATAKHFDISRTGLDRWITALENKGYQIIDNKKVSESGFGLLSDLNSARTKGLKPSEFVEGLPTAQTQEQETTHVKESPLALYQPQQLEPTTSQVEEYLATFSTDDYQNSIDAEFVDLDNSDTSVLANSLQFEADMIAQNQAQLKAEAELQEIRQRRIAQQAIAQAEADFALEQKVYRARKQQLTQSLGK